MEAAALVVHGADGRVVWEQSMERSREDVVHTDTEWAADGGTPLREEIDLDLRFLAHAFTYALFDAPHGDWKRLLVPATGGPHPPGNAAPDENDGR